MSQGNGASGQHSLESALQVSLGLVGPTGMTSNVLPHDVYDGGPDETVLDDEGEEVGRGVLDDGAHDVDPAAGVVSGERAGLAGRERLGVDVVAGVPQWAPGGHGGTGQVGRGVRQGVGEPGNVVLALAVGLEVEVAEDALGVGRRLGGGLPGHYGGVDARQGGRYGGYGAGGQGGAGLVARGAWRRGHRRDRVGPGRAGVAYGSGRRRRRGRGLDGPRHWLEGRTRHAAEARGRGGDGAGKLVGVRSRTQAEVVELAGTLAQDGTGVAQGVVLYAR